MSKLFNHTCIKPECSEKYQDSDPDGYYCPSCVEAKKAIAKQIDKKFAGRETKPKEYDEIERWKKEGGFMPIIRN